VKGADTWLSLVNYYCANQQTGCASNNGNVLARTIDDGSSIYTQSFEYDGVNRLERASEVGGWVRDYVYDRFGNRAVRDTSYLPYPTRTPQVAEATASAVEAIYPNNRWTGATHDAAGGTRGRGAVFLGAAGAVYGGRTRRWRI